MTVEYMVLGVVLVVMGAVQIWLRYGPWAKEQQAPEAAAAERSADNGSAAGGKTAGGNPTAVQRGGRSGPVIRERGAKVWTTWTAILGPLAIVFGLVLVILGALGF
jgi:hypothetical protein